MAAIATGTGACDEPHIETPHCNGIHGIDNAPSTVHPENLIRWLEVIYNDRIRSAADRLALFQLLLPPADHDSLTFVYLPQPGDTEYCGAGGWRLSREIETHRNMFEAYESREQRSLKLLIANSAPEPLEHPRPGQENWVRIFARNIILRIELGWGHELFVDGDQAEFICAPSNGCWYIVEWHDLPSPEGPPPDPRDGRSTWGHIKCIYQP
jgi:hypothetical protein